VQTVHECLLLYPRCLFITHLFLGVFLCAGSLSHLILADARRESPQRMSVNPATVELTCAALFQCRPSWRRVRFCELYVLTLFAQTHTHIHTGTGLGKCFEKPDVAFGHFPYSHSTLLLAQEWFSMIIRFTLLLLFLL
jgi:hypothetical protein